MAENSNISWTDHTFNPWIGCTRISPACDGCYAAGLMGTASRFGPPRAIWGGPGKGEGTRTRTADSTWAKVRGWNKKAADAPGKTFVFCSSLADVFDNHRDVAPWRRDLFDLIRATPNLTWLLLTKRPGNIVKLWAETMADASGPPVALTSDFWPRNAAIGCTIANQEEADRDIPKLLAAKAVLNPAFAFLSMEPLLGPVDLTNLPWRFNAFGAEHRAPVKAVNGLTGKVTSWDPGFPVLPGETAPLLDWIITGGETDQKLEDGTMHRARPADPAWYRSLRDQCAAAGVTFHFKQWGEWQPMDAARIVQDGPLAFENGHVPDWMDRAVTLEDGSTRRVRGHSFTGHATNLVYRVGKDRDPCTLDGVVHDARPEVRR